MTISTRSILMSGMATLTATAIALTPVQALPRDVVVPAAATVQQVPSQQLVDLLAAVQRLAPNSAAGAAPSVGVQQAAPVPGSLAFPGLGNAIINTYNFVEPFVAYGVQWAQYAVGWVPFGYLISDQIGIFYFNLIEPITQTITYNIAYWIGGSKSFLQALNDGILGTANAGIGFLNAEIRWGWGLLPPLPFPPPQIPYLPWFGLLQTQTAGVTAAGLAPDVGVTNAASDLVNAIYTPVSNAISYGVGVFNAAVAPIPLVNVAGAQANILWNILADPIADSVVYQLIDPVLNQPLNINSYINGAINVGATTVSALVNTGIAEANYFLGIPLAASASTQRSAELKPSGVSSVPLLVKDTLAGVRHVDSGAKAGKTTTPGPLNEVRETVNDVRNVIRGATGGSGPETTKSGDDAENVGNDIVRTRHDVRGAITKAVDDVTGALGTGKPSKSADGATKASTNVVKSLGDTAKKVVKQVRQAAKDARDAGGNRPSSGADE